MTKEEYEKQKKKLSSKLDKTFQAALQGGDTEEYLKTRKQLLSLYSEVKLENWYKHI